MPEIVERVTRQTEGRLRRFKQVLPNGTMGIVAGHAIFDGWRVFKNPRTHQILMTARATLIAVATGNTRVLVRVVARKAAQRSFSHWVMRGHVLRGCDIRVTGNTKLRRPIHIGERHRFTGPQELSRRRVRVVAIRAEEACTRMSAGTPLEMTISARHVTSEAVLIGRVSDLQRIFAIRMEAPRPVAAIAVLVIRRDLCATLHFIVAQRALVGVYGRGPDNSRSTSRPNGLPFE